MVGLEERDDEFIEDDMGLARRKFVVYGVNERLDENEPHEEYYKLPSVVCYETSPEIAKAIGQQMLQKIINKKLDGRLTSSINTALVTHVTDEKNKVLIKDDYLMRRVYQN